MNGTPDADDGLRITKSTDVEDVRDFVKRRTKNPLTFEDEGVTVWNYTSHEPDMGALEDKVITIRRGEYVIPYQVPGAWGYMQDLIPDPIRDATLLVYSQKDRRYKAFPNFRELSDGGADFAVQLSLEKWLNEEGP